MSDRPANIEATGKESVSRASKQPKVVGADHNPRQQILKSVKPSRKHSASQEMHDIALTEFVRRRRELGNLTSDQVLCIETLLISTVDRISEMVVAVTKLTA